jgi:hypothetical protein
VQGTGRLTKREKAENQINFPYELAINHRHEGFPSQVQEKPSNRIGSNNSCAIWEGQVSSRGVALASHGIVGPSNWSRPACGVRCFGVALAPPTSITPVEEKMRGQVHNRYPSIHITHDLSIAIKVVCRFIYHHRLCGMRQRHSASEARCIGTELVRVQCTPDHCIESLPQGGISG